jgi:hypothetical protein
MVNKIKYNNIAGKYRKMFEVETFLLYFPDFGIVFFINLDIIFRLVLICRIKYFLYFGLFFTAKRTFLL